MAYNGSGTFVRLRNWQADATAGVKIRADYHDTEDDGFASGLTNAITRDGQSPPSANLPMNAKIFTNLGNGSAATDSAAYGQIIGYNATVGANPSGIVISGSTPNSRLKYTGTTGPWGDSFTTADTSNGVRGTAWVWNDQDDFSGTDVMTLTKLGTLTLTHKDDSASATPVLYLFHDSTTPAVSDYCGGIYWRGRDSTAVVTDYGRILTYITDPVNASEDASMTLGVVVAGTMTTRLTLDVDGVDVTGKLTSSGDFSCGGVVRSATTFFVGNSAQIILGPDTGGTPTGILFRPTNYSLSTGTMSISPAGNVVIAGTLDVNGTSTICNVFYAGEVSQGINGIANCCITNAAGAFMEGPNGALATGKIGANGTLMGIYQGTTVCGSITVANAATTAYNTSSDIRIKKGVRGVAGTDARALVDAMQVIAFEPVTRQGEIVEVQGVTPGPEVWMGFSAQQAYEVFPTAVAPPEAMIGQVEKYRADAKVGEEGFVPWMLDYSKFVPMLMANVQELNARNDALEARLASLETAA